MTSKRKSFLLHIDSLDVLDDLSNEQAGMLFKAIKYYQHGESIELEPVVKIAFSPFKNQFARDNEKYIKTCKARAIAGSKGGNQKVANASNSKQKVANLAENKNKNKSDNKDLIVANAPKYSQDDYNCAAWMLKMIKEINPKFKQPNLNTWADDIRKIINIDKRTYQEIKELFQWVNRDDFWSANILSPATLRRQWDKIYMKANRVNKPNIDLDQTLSDSSWADGLDEVL
jgi:hypothetical protein